MVGEALGVDRGCAKFLDGAPQPLVANGGRHPRARRPPELDRRGADASGAAVDEQVLAGAQAALGEQRVVGGDERLGRPPAPGQSSASGTGIAPRSCSTASSAWPPPPTIAITRSPSSNRGARPEAHDLARQLEPGDVLGRARRDRIVPRPLEHVGPVEPGRPHGDQHLSRSWSGIRVILDAQSALFDGHGTH